MNTDLIPIDTIVENSPLSHEELAEKIGVGIYTFNQYLINGVDKTTYSNILYYCKEAPAVGSEKKTAEVPKAKKKAPGFYLYDDMYPLFTTISKEQCGELVQALFEYHCNGLIIETKDSIVQLGFDLVRPKIDINQEKYEETCRKRTENAKKRYENKT